MGLGGNLAGFYRGYGEIVGIFAVFGESEENCGTMGMLLQFV